MDPETLEEVGKSKKAAAMGIQQSINCRWIYLVPIFFANPVFEGIFNAAGLMPKAGPMKRVLELSFVTVGLAVAIPVCCSVYTQL